MWNYRIFEHTDGHVEIVEAYYDDDGRIFGTTAVSLVQDTYNDLLRDIAAIQQAFAAPIICVGDITGTLVTEGDEGMADALTEGGTT